METIVVSTGWLVFISILTILHQLEIKIIIIILLHPPPPPPKSVLAEHKLKLNTSKHLFGAYAGRIALHPSLWCLGTTSDDLEAIPGDPVEISRDCLGIQRFQIEDLELYAEIPGDQHPPAPVTASLQKYL